MSCGPNAEYAKPEVRPVNIDGSTYYLSDSSPQDFEYLQITGGQEEGEKISVTYFNYEVQTGVFTDCEVEGVVTFLTRYYVSFIATVVETGDTTNDTACSNAFRGSTLLYAGDEFLNLTGNTKSYELEL